MPLFSGVRGRGILRSPYPVCCMDRLLGSPEDLSVPVLCMEVNATCISPAWISALVNGTGRSIRRWKFLIGTSPRRFCGPSSACYIWFAKEPATRNPRTLDPNPDAMPCNRGQHREQEAPFLYGICKPLQLSATTDRTLVMSRKAARVRSSALFFPHR
jgi:hypothetical protein